MAKVLKVVLWLVFLPVGTGLPACLPLGDCFLEVGATVVDCATSQPLAGVAVSEHIDMGLHEGNTKNDVATTKADGTFALPTDQDCGAWVTLRLSRTGYTTLETQVKGSPPAPLALCLIPAPSP
jgi:hypothetical protein